MKQIDRVQSAFSRQATKFGEAKLTLGRQELLHWVSEALPLAPETRALDVAAGTCHLSREVAPRVRSVAAIDITPAMLHEARTEAARNHLVNLHLVQADAGLLPFADEEFDLIMCRLAVHHFADPAVEIAEMNRVARRSGALAIVDLLAPDHAAFAERYNTFERMRDPSHTRALTAADLGTLVEASGRPIRRRIARDVEVDFNPWLALTGTPLPTRKAITEALERELAGGSATGLRPRERAGRLSFLQTWQIVLTGPRG